jgi:hypothetical protein
MKPSPLLSAPDFVSQFDNPRRAEYEAAVGKRVDEYFCSHWPWTSERHKEIYTQQVTELIPLLVCPRAPEDCAELAEEMKTVKTQKE